MLSELEKIGKIVVSRFNSFQRIRYCMAEKPTGHQLHDTQPIFLSQRQTLLSSLT